MAVAPETEGVAILVVQFVGKAFLSYGYVEFSLFFKNPGIAEEFILGICPYNKF